MYQELVATLVASVADAQPAHWGRLQRTALNQIGRALGTDAAALYLRRLDGHAFQASAGFQRGGEDSALGERFESRAMPWLVERLEKHAMVDIADVGALPESASAERRWLEASVAGSAVFVPLVSRGSLLGALCVARRRVSGGDTAPFDDAQIRVLRIAADLLAGALEREHAEAALRRTQAQRRDEERMTSLGQLTGGVAHDFNNFLTAIIGYSDLVEDSLDAQADSETAGHVGEIRLAADHAAALVDRLMSFGRRGGAARPLDVSAVTADMRGLMRRIVGDEIEIETQLASDLGAVLAERGQIEQLLLNLASNARDAMPDGGRLTLRTSDLELTAASQLAPDAPPGAYVALTISDTGAGIAPEVLERLFEPFFTTKARGQGTGLGLVSVANVVRQLGGYVDVASAPGRGTDVTILLPRAAAGFEAVAVPAQAVANVRAPRGSETLLVVEDDASVRQLLRETLEHHGYVVLEASNAAEAVRICQAHDGPIALAIAELALPHLRGLFLARRLANVRPELRTFFVTGHAESVIREEAPLDPAVTLLEKPFAARELARAVRSSLDGAAAGEADRAACAAVISSRSRARGTHDADRSPPNESPRA